MLLNVAQGSTIPKQEGTNMNTMTKGTEKTEAMESMDTPTESTNRVYVITQCNFSLFNMMPPCILPVNHAGNHSDGFGGHYTESGAFAIIGKEIAGLSL